MAILRMARFDLSFNAPAKAWIPGRVIAADTYLRHLDPSESVTHRELHPILSSILSQSILQILPPPTTYSTTLYTHPCHQWHSQGEKGRPDSICLVAREPEQWWLRQQRHAELE
jgi:hypothetical protein